MFPPNAELLLGVTVTLPSGPDALTALLVPEPDTQAGGSTLRVGSPEFAPLISPPIDHSEGGLHK